MAVIGRIRAVALVSVLCLVSSCENQGDARASRVAALFRQYDKANEPGCAVGVAKGGQPVFSEGYGLADIVSRKPITPETVFKVASVSKMFTAASMLLLAQHGALSLDDELHKHIPELPDYGTPVTIRRLLNHTGGLPEYEAAYSVGGLDYDSASRADQIQAITGYPKLTSQPGENYAYTNTDYLLLAVILERVSGNALGDFARTQIFEPLGMSNTAYRGEAAVLPSGAIPYQVDANGVFRASLSAAHIGPTGLQTNVIDLLTWGKNFTSNEVGNGELIVAMQTREHLNNGQPLDYGYGLMLGTLNGHDVLMHDGATDGVRTIFARILDADMTIAVLCNRSDVRTKKILTELVTIFEK